MKPSFLGKILIAIFLFAVVMGAGPGVFLINPDPGDPDAKRFLFGMPIVYVWAASWFIVQAVCVFLAYRTLWREGAGSGEKGGDQ